MNKLILLTCTFLVCQWSSAQWFGQKNIKGNGKVTQENRNTANYDQINSAGFFDIELISGSEGSITIKGEENLIPHIITEVNGNQLIIKTEKGYNLQPSKRHGILVQVPFESIDQVSLTGSGNILGKDAIKGTSFKTKLTGSGDINLSLDVESLETLLVGSGEIELHGTTQKVAHQITGSGDISGFNLKAVDAQANISGSGDIELHCDGYLKIRITGSGDVNYIGNPTTEDSKIAGSGDVTRE